MIKAHIIVQRKHSSGYEYNLYNKLYTLRWYPKENENLLTSWKCQGSLIGRTMKKNYNFYKWEYVYHLNNLNIYKIINISTELLFIDIL